MFNSVQRETNHQDGEYVNPKLDYVSLTHCYPPIVNGIPLVQIRLAEPLQIRNQINRTYPLDRRRLHTAILF